MNKKLLNRISNLIFVILILLSSNKIYAIGDKIVTFQAVEVPITSQSFIFKEAYGSLEDDFDDVFKEVESFIQQSGATSSRKAILYLDYGVERINPNMLRSATTIKEPLMKYLTDTYGESTLKSYRRVLVGYLVPPQYYVAPREPFKEYSFKNIRALATQSVDKDSKTPISELTDPLATPSVNQATNNYLKPNRLHDKISMMNYLAINESLSNSIGMLEMYDTKLNIFTFMAIPGNQDEFLKTLGISPFVKAGEFQRRPDVIIEEQNTSNQPTNNNTNSATAEGNQNTTTGASEPPVSAPPPSTTTENNN